MVVQVLGRERPVHAAHGEVPQNLLRKVAIRIPSDYRNLVTLRETVCSIVRVVGIPAIALVDDAWVLDLRAFWRLEIYSKRGARQVDELLVKTKPLAHDTRLQCLGLSEDTEPQRSSLSSSFPSTLHNASRENSEARTGRTRY